MYFLHVPDMRMLAVRPESHQSGCPPTPVNPSAASAVRIRSARSPLSIWHADAYYNFHDRKAGSALLIAVIALEETIEQLAADPRTRPPPRSSFMRTNLKKSVTVSLRPAVAGAAAPAPLFSGAGPCQATPFYRNPDACFDPWPGVLPFALKASPAMPAIVTNEHVR